MLGVHDDTADIGLLYHDASLGRFLNQDPIGSAGGANLYRYSGNNPLTWIDPSGENPWNIKFPRRKLYRKGECDSLREAIQSGHKQILRRTKQLNENLLDPLNALPYWTLNDFNCPGESVRGHEWLLLKEHWQYFWAVAEYLLFCSDKFGPPPPVIFDPLPVYVPEPVSIPSRPFSIRDLKPKPLSPEDAAWWIIVTTAAYVIISEGSRLFPLRNLVPVL